ncbi:MAG: YMGG-like glycine zipper-containing protein [Candidatus Hydrogenedentes bacterium]|nr:YMGG-like glycine zipper-containing protein [Candidatus Hydrogenedentota bacterium]
MTIETFFSARSRKQLVSAIALGTCVALVGCETAGRSAGLGAAVGAGAGAIIGNQSGNATEGALIGAAIGGLAGWGIHKVKARRTRTAEETAQQHQYDPASGFKLALTDGSKVTPLNVKPGASATSVLEYAALGTGANGLPVREQFILKKDGKPVKELYDSTTTRTDGTWQSPIEFALPAQAPAGQYIVAQTVSAAGQSAQKDVTFTVTTATSKSGEPEAVWVMAQN